jgi:hypothetical protein
MRCFAHNVPTAWDVKATHVLRVLLEKPTKMEIVNVLTALLEVTV